MTICALHAFGPSLGNGSIRTQPEDFRVTELYDFEPAGEGEHLLLWIEKRGANTGWVGNQLANHFGLRHFDVGYCGKKDRHAVTYQWFSCWLPGSQTPDVSDCDIEGVKIVNTSWHSKKLRRGDHLGNRFSLLIRNVETLDTTKVDERLETIRSSGFPNFFGRQRFGFDGQNLTKALDLIGTVNDRRRLDRKQKDIYLSALRSWMFNDILSKQVESGKWLEGGEAWVHGLSPHRDIELPEVSEEFLAAAEFIEKMGIKAHQRPVKILPMNMQWQWQEAGLLLEFDLPNGAYATTLLEQVMEIEDAHQ